ncbi:MAG TPA: hypothetical protein VFV38_26120 [Ktedonobacteraceae bacterium]|nr:hypothetical protein [Ktedonobacteraceae bacterium]
MKFRCPCGHIIRDQTDALSYKAQFIPDEDEEADFDMTVERIEAFIIARESGNLEEFLHDLFGEYHPVKEDLTSILFDLLTIATRSARFIYECENCGRVFIQKHCEYGHNVYATYLPEDEVRHVLQSQRKHRD